MKITMFAVCLLTSSSAFAQAVSVTPATGSSVVMWEHPGRAAEHPMSQDANLRGDSAYSYAKGEQPMWEFGSGKIEVPLGDVARAYRQQHAQNQKKKSAKVSSND